MRRWLKVLLGGVGIVVLVLSYVAYSIWVFSNVDETKQADVAIVLGAAIDGGQPSPVFKARIDHAIQLYNSGVVEALVFTGGVGAGNSKAESEVARDYAVEQGVDVAHIYIETQSTITEQNIVEAKRLMDEHSFTDCLLVSDPLHMKRAMALAKFYEVEVYSSPTQSSMYQSLKTQIPFLARELFYYIGFQLTKPFRSVANV